LGDAEKIQEKFQSRQPADDDGDDDCRRRSMEIAEVKVVPVILSICEMMLNQTPDRFRAIYQRGSASKNVSHFFFRNYE
jgi:hypothetical protein